MDTNYSSNITEKIRVDIGKMLLIHEFKKLFPILTTECYENLERDVLKLVSNQDSGNDVGIRNFWNLVDAIMMGYMLKDLVPKITSACFDWSLQNLPIDNLRFTSDITQIEGFDINKQSVLKVSQYLQLQPDTLRDVKEKILKNFPVGDNRHLDPVVILCEGDDYFVHDGNGRIMKAIVNGNKTISAYVGVKNTLSKCNSWVPTSYLMRLKEEAKTTKSVRELLEEISSSSHNVQYELEKRVI